VLDVTLTAVKVMNWDNTTAMLPPHTLVSGSFQNYRSMYQSGGRRVMVSVYVDPCTVSAATDELYGSVASELPLMGDYIAKVRGEGGLDLGAIRCSRDVRRIWAFSGLTCICIWGGIRR
jgi:miniconductance mechanosensitive channel